MKLSKKNIIILVSLLIVLFVYVAIFANSFMNKNSKMGFLSYNFFIVSESNNDIGVNKGDLAIVKNVELSEIRPDDNIVYKQEEDISIKSVKDVSTSNGKVNIIIKDSDDSSKNQNTKILGKMTGKLAGIGNLAMLIQTPAGAVILLSVFVCILLIIKKLNYRDAVSENEEGGSELENDEKK